MNKIRHLDIKVIAMDDFVRYHKKNWKELIENTIRKSSDVFEKEFGIKLVLAEIEIKKHHIDSAVPFSIFNYSDLILNATKNPDEFDTTIVFTNSPLLFGFSEMFHGIIFKEKKLIFLTNPKPTDLPLHRLLIHELGHLFGAQHVESENSFMDTWDEGCCFDKPNKNIILQNKWKIFKSAH